MKIALLFLLLIPGLTSGQSPKAELTFQNLKARLIDFTPNKLCAFCGYSLAASTLKFEVVEDNSAFHKGETILVVIPCAADIAEVHHKEKGGVLFEDKQGYLLKLYKPATLPADVKQFQDLHMLYYEDEKLPRFCCESLVRL